MYSVYDLAYDYIKENGIQANGNEKRLIIDTVMGVLSDGTVSDDINKKIKNVKNVGGKSQGHSEYFKSIKSTGNLLNHTKHDMFYHNELRIKPGAPLIWFDVDSGEVKKVKQDYFLEMRASYTLDNLYEYAVKKEFLAKSIENKARAIGGLKYLVGRYNVDFLLFLIDTANEMYSSKLRHLRNILDIVEYEIEAKENYERRMTECAISDTDKIVPKKREELPCAV